MSPQDQQALVGFTRAAKKIIFDADRFKVLLQMMGTKVGAVHAVQAVLAGIDHHKPIPGNIVHQLAANVYLIMVELAQDSTGHKADKGIVHDVLAALKATTDLSHPAQPMQPAQPQGIIASRMGAM